MTFSISCKMKRSAQKFCYLCKYDVSKGLGYKSKRQHWQLRNLDLKLYSNDSLFKQFRNMPQQYIAIHMALCMTILKYANTGDIRDMSWIPGSGRSPGVGNGNPLQYSCLQNSMDRGAWL